MTFLTVLKSATTALMLSAATMAWAQQVSQQDLLDDVVAAAREWAADPIVVTAVQAQNKESIFLSPSEIDRLDADWRAQKAALDAPMIDEVASREASVFVTERRDESGGVITEVIVMDAVGLTVAMSDRTSDYWQGDEPKFQQTFGRGPDAVHVEDVALDSSTLTYQSQVSFTIVDPESGAPIGAVTIGVDLDALE